MKKLLTGLTAVSVLGMNLLLGGLNAHANVLADHTDNVENNTGGTQRRGIHTEGSINFIADDSPIEVIPPGEDDLDVDIPALPSCDEDDEECKEDEGGNFGPLTIAYAPTLRFGEQIVSLEDQRYHMIAEMQTLRGTEEQVPYVSFVQVQDRRGTHDGWSLYLTASEFESDSKNHPILGGAQISFSGGRLVHSGDDNPVGNPNRPDIIEPSFTLEPNQGQVIMAATDGNGAGISSLVWGDQAEINRQATENEVVKNEAIELFVPGTSVQNATTYTANLHWQLVAGYTNTLSE